MILVISSILLVLFVSAFFSGSEAAIMSITPTEIELLRGQRRFGSHSLQKVHMHIDRSVIAIVIMNNISSIVGSVVVGQIVVHIYGSNALAVVTTALTFAVILFAEIIPKSLGIHYNVRIARISAPVIYYSTLFWYPVVLVLEWLMNKLKHGEKHIGTEEQIRSLVTMGRKAGHIEIDEGHLIHRAFILNDKTAYDSMTPLKDIVGIQYTMSIYEAYERVKNSGYSRLPVFGDSINEITGLVLMVDLLHEIAEGNGEHSIDHLNREAFVVPAHTSLDDLLLRFRDLQTHLAVVQSDDHTVGLITLEDVLEELVGEIEDETDAEI